MMQDGKALQAGTSHNLGQNFARAFEMQYLGRDNQLHLCHTTSWGVSTRLIGALIMVHSDDEGLIVPPKLAPTLVAIVPIYKNDAEKAKVVEFCRTLLGQLCGEARLAAAEKLQHGRELLSVFVDDRAVQSVVLDLRDERPVEKHFHWEQQGVPFRLEIGPRDVDKQAFVLKLRHSREKSFHEAAAASPGWLQGLVETTQHAMHDKAEAFLKDHLVDVSTYDELKEAIAKRSGFVRCWFAEDAEAEAAIKAETKATVRCVPFEQSGETGLCVYSGKETREKVLFAVSY